ncbi:MAG: TRAP transporter small permease [Pseudomonadota bacterium]
MNSALWRHLLNWLLRIETGFLVMLLCAMISMAVLQIILRNFFDSGISWGEPFVRVLLLWVSMAGAMYATREDRHIRIDLASKLLPERINHGVNGLVTLCTAIICGIAAWYSLKLVMFEYEDGLIAFANVPTWVCELILPVAFAVITLRYLLHTFINFMRVRA